MKIKIFYENIKDADIKINNWIVNNSVEVIDVKINNMLNDKILITILYEEVVDITVNLDEFGNVIQMLKS